MRIPAEFTESDLKDAHAAAGVVASGKFRPYLPGRLLPLLITKFHDDVAVALHIELPALPKRPPSRAATLDELTSSEFTALSDAVGTLVTRFTPCMDDPELPRLLRELRDALLIEDAERRQIAAEMTSKARAS